MNVGTLTKQNQTNEIQLKQAALYTTEVYSVHHEI